MGAPRRRPRHRHRRCRGSRRSRPRLEPARPVRGGWLPRRVPLRSRPATRQGVRARGGVVLGGERRTVRPLGRPARGSPRPRGGAPVTPTVLVLTTADTEILALRAVAEALPFAVRAANPASL